VKKVILPLLLGLVLSGQAEDDLSHYTSVGNLAMTVTNFGVLGHGYNIQGQPSCVYRFHSELEFEVVEHFSYGGLWLGGIVNDSTRVTTGVIDGNLNVARGWEWNPTWEPMITRSSIVTSANYSQDAISHQDFLCSYTDTSRYNAAGELIEDHNPLGVKVNLRSYAWNYSFADAFVILEHEIVNLGSDIIQGIHAGYWLDEAVGNFNLHDYYAPGGGGWYWYDNMAGAVKVDTVDADTSWMAIGYDADGDDGYSESFIGVRFLGADGQGVVQDSVQTTFGFWEWNNHGAVFHPELSMPANDEERYTCLGEIENIYADEFPYDESEDASWMMLSGAGNLGDLAPGDTMTVVFTIVAGRWAQVVNSEPDAPWLELQQKARNVILNSNWAQIAYNGEDANGDHILTAEEDLNGNGIIDRYLLPEPPPAPNLHAEVGDHEITLYWDNMPESFIDPIQAEADFEGYRVYASPRNPESGAEKTLLAQFDLLNGPNHPPNTGMGDIELAEPVTIDGHQYHYSYHIPGLVNGLPTGNWFAVSSFDRGNPDNNLPSLESAHTENWIYAFPGTISDDNLKPAVVPNPYRAQADWDGYSAYDRLVWFVNLPASCEIRIFTLSGDLVEIISHDAATYQGGDYLRFELMRERLLGGPTAPDFVFSGGAHAWDLVTRHEQELATGLYLFSVHNRENGMVDIGKFMVIK